MKSYQVDKDGYYGEFGGAYIPEILHKCVEELTNTYLTVLNDESFKQEFDQLLRDYVGRPSPLYLARRLSEKSICICCFTRVKRRFHLGEQPFPPR